MKSKFLEKAALQALCEILGFEEGNSYFFLLNKKDSQLNKEYSYSKRYRILKSLFNQGAVGKIRPEKQEFFNYMLLPPSFLLIRGIEPSIVYFLEKLYKNNFSSVFETKYSQIILKDEQGLIIFLLRHQMKNYAKLACGNVDVRNLVGTKSGKVTTLDTDSIKRKIGVIDGKVGFEFLMLKNMEKVDYFGYLSRECKNGFISELEKELEEYCF